MNTIVSQFNIQGNVVEVAPLGNGLINTTYRVKTEGDAPDYVLQHVNNAIFPDVDMLMNNIVAVQSTSMASWLLPVPRISSARCSSSFLQRTASTTTLTVRSTGV